MTDLGDDLYGINTTDRGFRHLPPIEDTHGNGEIRVYESSAADGPHVWLRAEDLDGHVTLHLTADAALRLARHLQWMVENHYQNDGADA